MKGFSHTNICDHSPPNSLPIQAALQYALVVYSLFFSVYLFYFTLLYWFCHTLTWILHGCTCVPHPEPASHLPPHPIPLGHPNAPAPSTLSCIKPGLAIHFTCDIIHVSMPFSHIIVPLPSPTESKRCSIHLCLFCCLAYRVTVTFFLNSIYMR